jgi:O-succinylbenzoate synthase
LSFRRYRLPFRLPVNTAHGVWREREGVIVRLETATGVTGLGEAAPIPGFGTETIDEVEAACRAIGEWCDDSRLAAVPVELASLRNALGVARAETARAMEQPTDRNASGPGYLGVAALLPAGRAALAQIATRADAGFRAFKWKVGVAAAADELALLDDLCAALPDGARVRLDANGAWDRRTAERWLARCAERPVEFVEQPVARDFRGAEDLLLGLAHDYPTPVALDESLTCDGDVERWVGTGWPGVFVVKPSLLGNVTGVLAMLERAWPRVVFSSALETAVGARSALRAAFGFAARKPDQPHRALGFGVWPLFADARFDGPAAAPFVREEDVERIDPEAVWNALN